MPAGKMEPVIAYPPMEQWDALLLPEGGDVQRFDGLNMPHLTSLTCAVNPVTALPWNDLKNLTRLRVYWCDLRSLPLWRLPHLVDCFATGNAGLLEVDAHDNPSLLELDAVGCSSLAEVNLLGCTNLAYVFFNDCAFPQEAVDQILADLVANGVTGGYLDLFGLHTAAPSIDGIANRNILLSRDWTVFTN